jgi:hypothetical protein
LGLILTINTTSFTHCKQLYLLDKDRTSSNRQDCLLIREDAPRRLKPQWPDNRLKSGQRWR